MAGSRADDSLLAQHIEAERYRDEVMLKEMAEIKAMFAAVGSAFPKDAGTGLPDFKGHHDAHRAWMEAQNAKREFWDKLKYELTKWGLIGFLGWLLVQVVWPAIVRGHP